MKVSEAFKALGDQHLEEQNLMSNGISAIKDFFENRKVKKDAGMKTIQAELLSKKLESNLASKAQKKPKMKI
jgi:hypothetical protein